MVGVVSLQLGGKNTELPEGDVVLRLPVAAFSSTVQHLDHLRRAGVQQYVVEQGLDHVVRNGGAVAHPGMPTAVQVTRSVAIDSLRHILVVH